MLSLEYAEDILSVDQTFTGAPLTVFEIPDMDEIWKPKGTLKHNIAIWRAKSVQNYHSLGDVAVPGGKAPKVFLIKENKAGALVPPTDFRQVWNDRLSSMKWNASIWEPIPPPGYRALGCVAIRSHSDKPAADIVQCVKSEYTTKSSWKWIWNNEGSSSKVPVSIWKAVMSANGQGVEAMSSVPRHDNMDKNAYVLNKKMIYFLKTRPAVRYVLKDVKYSFDDRQVVGRQSETLLRAIVENKKSSDETLERAFSYNWTQFHTWSGTADLEVGVQLDIKSGIPCLEKGKVSLLKAIFVCTCTR